MQLCYGILFTFTECRKEQRELNITIGHYLTQKLRSEFCLCDKAYTHSDAKKF
jgi:hypothetical protein